MSDNKKPAIRFNGFTDDWEQRKLGELGTITTGSTPSTSIPDYYSDDGIVWVTPTDICENITFESARKLSDLGQQVGRVVPKNTILVTCIASIGKNTMLGNTGSFNQQINGLTPNENECDPYFLLTESALWSAKMKSSAAAGTMQIVNRTEFSELKTWLPSLIEQQAISNFFRQLDNLITLHQRKCERLQTIKKAMLEKMFPQNGSKVPEIRFAGFTDDWEQRKVGETVTEVSRPIELNDYQEYQLVTVKRRNEGIVSRGKMYGKNILVKNYFEIHAGDYLISKRQLVHGANGIVPENLDKAVVSNEYMACVSNEFVTAEFLTLLSKTKSLQRDFFLSSYGVDIEKLVFDVEDWKKRSIIIPKIEEQNKICEYFSYLDHLITLHQRQLEKLQNIKKSMLEKMFV